jgi:hypothetical protein
MNKKADGGTRTRDPRFTKALLYQLSYIGLLAIARKGHPRRTI